MGSIKLNALQENSTFTNFLLVKRFIYVFEIKYNIYVYKQAFNYFILQYLKREIKK